LVNKRLLHGWPIVLGILCLSASAHSQNGVRLIGNANIPHGSGYAGCWGYTAPDGREYVITGCRNGTSIIDITDTLSLQEVAFISGPSSTWREMRTYQNYAYVVTEAGGGTQIIDLSGLPDTAVLVTSFTYTSGSRNTSRAHTIEIFDGYMYLNGCASWTQSPPLATGGIVIFSLTNPTSPQFMGSYDDRYIHDSYVRNDTIFAAAINSGGGVDIIDARVKSNPQAIARITYSGSGTHNAWTTKNGGYVISTDEISSTPKNLKFWDLSMLPSPPSGTASTYTFSPTDIVHNVTVRGNYAYTAWYTAGLVVTNVSNPLSPTTAGWYDTYPGASGGYNGAWAVYPYFPSGKIAVSDIQTGTWVFMFNNLQPRRSVQLLTPIDGDTVRTTNPLRFKWTSAANMQADPHYYELVLTGPGVNSTFKVYDTVMVVSNFSGFQSGQSYQWYVRTKDEFNNTMSQDTLLFYFVLPPSAPTLVSPANGSTDISVPVTLMWNAASGATTYHLQVSTDSLFGTAVADESTLVTTSYQVVGLANNTTYFWHVRAKAGSVAGTYSPTWKFMTATGSQIVQQHSVANGWNLLSLPLLTADPRTDVLYPTAVSEAFTYDAGAGYQEQDTLFPGSAYWIKFDSSQSLTYTGQERLADTVEVSSGWNMIGVLSGPIAASAVQEVPDGIIVSNYFGYDGSYTLTDTLAPGRGYWVKAGQTGMIIMNVSTGEGSVQGAILKERLPSGAR